jgi:phenylpyruvate tautomerase PptA (4-oxalocrotonate tautomerase family)
MPYIAINTTEKMTPAKQEALKSELGALISIIPTKTEAGLLIDFSGDHSFYRAGTPVNGAYVELHLYRPADYEAKKKFTEEVFSLLVRELGIETGNMCLNIIELDHWGGGGTLR